MAGASRSRLDGRELYSRTCGAQQKFTRTAEKSPVPTGTAPYAYDSDENAPARPDTASDCKNMDTERVNMTSEPSNTASARPVRTLNIRLRIRFVPYGLGALRTASEYTFTYMERRNLSPARPVRTRRGRYGVGTLGYGVGTHECGPGETCTGSERVDSGSASVDLYYSGVRSDAT